MRVTKYIPQYFNSLYEIEKEAFSDCWSEKTMKEELALKHAHYYVAIGDNEVLGYIGFWLLYNEAEIMKIAVKEKNRKNGIGCALLRAALEDGEMLGAKKFFLEVRENNICARKLYEKNGFISYGTREKYYEGKENAVLYKRNL